MFGADPHSKSHHAEEAKAIKPGVMMPTNLKVSPNLPCRTCSKLSPNTRLGLCKLIMLEEGEWTGTLEVRFRKGRILSFTHRIYEEVQSNT